MRGFSELLMAPQAASTSPGTARDSEQMIGPCTSSAMRWTAWKSPGELAAKPASMMSTFSRASCRAICIFSSTVMPMPADCSPSRSVVSRNFTCAAIGSFPSMGLRAHRALTKGSGASALIVRSSEMGKRLGRHTQSTAASPAKTSLRW